MTQKHIIFIIVILTIIISCRQESHDNNNFITSDATNVSTQTADIKGEWLFINMYKSIITSIDTLTKTPHKTKFGIPIMTFYSDSTYTDNQGDYVDKGMYLVNTKNHTLKTYEKNGNGDTLVHKILHLDNQYLLISTEDKYSYFYKRTNQ